MLEYPHSQHHLSRRDLVLIQEIYATFTSIAHADSTPEGLPPLIVSMFLGKLMQLISPQRSTCSSSSMAAVGESQGNGQ
jgi:predicted phage tail protein